ncbi:MAG TPA: hypothetical protein VIM70_09705 [Clostridium sp.]|uniref:hypothetical protein n=1 Tax=Clostridium sp. TaxID=1506 RepID=UPI002F93D671
MDIKKEFTNWLSRKPKKNGVLMSDSTVYKYVRAIDTISKDMMKENIISGDIYNITDKPQLNKTIALIKKNNNFNFKNDTGNNMYSVALGHYQDFINNK